MTTILLKIDRKVIKIDCECPQSTCEQELYLESNGRLEIYRGLEKVTTFFAPKWMYEEALKHAELEK